MYYTYYYCQILMKFEFSRQILKKPQIPNFMKIHPVVAILFRTDKHTEGQTNRRMDMTSRFSQLHLKRLIFLHFILFVG
jgi:hypothetical protein